MSAIRDATWGEKLDEVVAWWLRPMRLSAIATVRLGLGLVTALYFIDALTDASFWLGADGVHSSRNVADFLQTSGLETAASNSISPLFWTDVLWVYQAYCFIAILLAVAMMLGRGGRTVCVTLWIMVVFWANRLMWLAGLTETMLSLTLFATCFAPTWKWSRLKSDSQNLTIEPVSVATGLSLRLAGVQVSMIGVATWMSMLSGSVWWDGTGAVALAAPESVRAFAIMDYLRSPLVHELVALWIFLAVPIGLWLSWHGAYRLKTRRIGVAILMGWAMTLAILGSHWIYGGVLVSGFLSFSALFDRPASELPL